jgi:hypothetical protein
MIPADAEQARTFATSIGSDREASSSSEDKLKQRNEINLQSRKKRRSRRGRAQ